MGENPECRRRGGSENPPSVERQKADTRFTMEVRSQNENNSNVSRLFSFILLLILSCLLSPVSCLLSPVSCLLSPVSCLLSPVSCLLYSAFFWVAGKARLKIFANTSCSRVLSEAQKHEERANMRYYKLDSPREISSEYI
jgi:hypothetical protein